MANLFAPSQRQPLFGLLGKALVPEFEIVDVAAGFNELFRSGGVREVACLAHIRRKFVDVFQAEGSLIAEAAIKRIAGLYAVEKEGRGQPPDERVRLRQAQAKPIIDEVARKPAEGHPSGCQLNPAGECRLILVLLLALLLAACGSLGPATVATDRLAYARVTADSAKQQTLLNIVRLRYGDYVSFFHVGQVVSGYTLMGEGRVGANVFTRNWTLGDDLSLGALLHFEDRPTITYNPVTGPELAHSMLNPFPPGELFLMLAAGYPADLVLGIMVRSVEGLPNALQGGVPAEGAGRFSEIVELITRAQAAGLIGAKRDGDGQGPVVLVLREGEDAAAMRVIDRLRALLGLTAEMQEARIVYGTGPGPADEIVVQTRSIIDVLVALGARILVPSDHVAAGRTPATAVDPAGVAPVAQVRIRSSLVPPQNGFANVRYADHWYWIDEDDYPSKRAFSFLLFLSAVVESTGERQAPLLTIPTG